MTDFLVWTENQKADSERALNGFVLLTIDGRNVQEDFYSEAGVIRRCNRW